jgi:hypothetical protein
MYHVIAYKQGYYVALIHYISAVALAEAAEHGGMAGGSAFLGKIAAVVAEFIDYDIFLCTEQRIEGLA